MREDGRGAASIGYQEREVSQLQRGTAVGGLPLESPLGVEQRPDPCAIVIFGATGDLTERMLVPALFDLFCHGVIPREFAIVGFGRRDWDDEKFRQTITAAVDKFYGEGRAAGSECGDILREARYCHGDFDRSDGYQELGKVLDELDTTRGTKGNRVFYLATPPSLFPVVIRQLGATGLAQRVSGDGSRHEGWQRVVIEKPFGYDLDTARELNAVVNSVFDESQVYRIDHYLAKETVQNLLVFRFANGIFEPIWNRRYVDHVQITAAESLGVEHRGAYYDGAGALRDMIQNHLLQLLSMTAMEPPVAFTSDAVRDEKVKVLRAIRSIPESQVDLYAVRGQYVQGAIDGEPVPGYRQEDRVASDSSTETFAAVKFLIDNWRWQGVPFFLRTGKRLPHRVTEVAVQFKRPPHLLFRETSLPGDRVPPNVLVLRIQPDEGISLRFEAKMPGQAIRLQPVRMEFKYGSTLNELPFGAYETLLLDCMEGDSTRFNRADQVEESWRAVMPILNSWKTVPRRGVMIYEAGSWGPEAAEALLARDGRAWRRP
jgi:glucose-6-phosphate 1-dehydrogenase